MFLRVIRQHSQASAERGQVLIIGLVTAIGLVMVALSVANVGMMVAEKMHLQDTVDAAAYSAAVSEARYMNLSAYINRAMMANYNSMAFNTAVWATIDADDHGLAVITALLYEISAILFVFPITTAFAPNVDQVADVFRDYVHSPLHTLNAELNDLFAQDDDAEDLNQYIEMVNTYLYTLYQGMLYSAAQTMRADVAKGVASKMDDEVLMTSVLGLGAETVNYDELAKAVDWVIRDVDARDQPFRIFNDRFNKMAGAPEDESDNPLLLAATTEASLDKFTAGRTRAGDKDLLRNFNLGNIIPSSGAIEFALNAYCYSTCWAECAATLGFSCDCDCDAEINLIIGADIRDGQENKAQEDHVPVIARRRMREVNFFGLDLEFQDVPGSFVLDAILGSQGHTSGEKNNDVANVANATFSVTEGINFERALQCILSGCMPGTPIPTRGHNTMNIMQASIMLPTPMFPPLVVDDHWDGAWKDVEPVCTWEVIPPVVCMENSIDYLTKVLSDGAEEGVPKYDWKVDIDNVGFPNYIYPETGSELRSPQSKGGGENNRFTGPSIGVIGIKRRSDINTLRALNLGNQYSMSAIARAQVYYLRNPKRPKEKPSLFNPHWVARLAPLDSDDTPGLLKQGLPFLAGVGVPLTPAH